MEDKKKQKPSKLTNFFGVVLIMVVTAIAVFLLTVYAGPDSERNVLASLLCNVLFVLSLILMIATRYVWHWFCASLSALAMIIATNHLYGDGFDRSFPFLTNMPTIWKMLIPIVGVVGVYVLVLLFRHYFRPSVNNKFIELLKRFDRRIRSNSNRIDQLDEKIASIEVGESHVTPCTRLRDIESKVNRIEREISKKNPNPPVSNETSSLRGRIFATVIYAFLIIICAVIISPIIKIYFDNIQKIIPRIVEELTANVDGADVNYLQGVLKTLTEGDFSRTTIEFLGNLLISIPGVLIITSVYSVVNLWLDKNKESIVDPIFIIPFVIAITGFVNKAKGSLSQSDWFIKTMSSSDIVVPILTLIFLYTLLIFACQLIKIVIRISWFKGNVYEKGTFEYKVALVIKKFRDACLGIIKSVLYILTSAAQGLLKIIMVIPSFFGNLSGLVLDEEPGWKYEELEKEYGNDQDMKG